MIEYFLLLERRLARLEAILGIEPEERLFKGVKPDGKHDSPRLKQIEAIVLSLHINGKDEEGG